ncbi:MAG TPA: uridine diphosphate-N-acetylglucosamine-binding protein YvcK [Thermomicrobiales bacterium]|nr:uridine diphosphate-N-acetylglucosamine-binding protein YvcK [Thermomicrobiales bacterium]
MNYRIWLRPGMRVKRWILILFAGVLLTSLSTAMALAWLYRNYTVPDQFSEIVYYGTLQFIPHPYREILVVVPGILLVAGGIYKLSRSITAPLMETRLGEGGLAKIIETHRFGRPEPLAHIVAIGGGTGLSTLLRGIKHEPVKITAIVTAGDDGGSSGRLRTEFNVPAPGDIRNCLVALADSETLLSDLFQYRFDSEDSGLDGHSFGNLFITALTKVSGSFEQAIIESGRVLNIRGAVYPSSIENIVVGAEMADGSVLRGETTIVNARTGINRVFLDPPNAEAYLPAVKAILEADLVVLGPGSLYTSVIPNLLVEGIAHALRHTPAEKVYVCNVATQPGETDGYDVAEHIRGIHRHLGDLPIDRVLVNSNLEPSTDGIKPEWGVSAVAFNGLDEFDGRLVVEPRDVVNPDFPLRHDPEKLAKVLVDLARRTRMYPQPVRRYPASAETGMSSNGHGAPIPANGRGSVARPVK